MEGTTKRFLAMVATGLALMAPMTVALADADDLEKLTTEWWQWVLSIPPSENPLLDATGDKCMVGQHGENWFLAGTLFGGSATRQCSVPEGARLFFPVVNSVSINTPNVCGSGPTNDSVKTLRAASAAFIEGATNLSVTVDGKQVKHLRRIQSDVFSVALPEDNVFDAPCMSLGNVPAGIYSPAVDDGFYVRLHGLKAGSHTLQIHAENPSQGFLLDVTYSLTIVPILLK